MLTHLGNFIGCHLRSTFFTSGSYRRNTKFVLCVVRWAFPLSLATSSDAVSHQVDKIVDQLQQLMQVYDLAALRDYWSYLERRLFSRLEDIYRPTINKLKTSLFRFYLVYTIQVLLVFDCFPVSHVSLSVDHPIWFPQLYVLLVLSMSVCVAF